MSIKLATVVVAGVNGSVPDTANGQHKKYAFAIGFSFGDSTNINILCVLG